MMKFSFQIVPINDLHSYKTAASRYSAIEMRNAKIVFLFLAILVIFYQVDATGTRNIYECETCRSPWQVFNRGRSLYDQWHRRLHQNRLFHQNLLNRLRNRQNWIHNWPGWGIQRQMQLQLRPTTTWPPWARQTSWAFNNGDNHSDSNENSSEEYQQSSHHDYKDRRPEPNYSHATPSHKETIDRYPGERYESAYHGHRNWNEKDVRENVHHYKQPLGNGIWSQTLVNHGPSDDSNENHITVSTGWIKKDVRDYDDGNGKRVIVQQVWSNKPGEEYQIIKQTEPDELSRPGNIVYHEESLKNEEPKVHDVDKLVSHQDIHEDKEHLIENHVDFISGPRPINKYQEKLEQPYSYLKPDLDHIKDDDSHEDYGRNDVQHGSMIAVSNHVEHVADFKDDGKDNEKPSLLPSGSIVSIPKQIEESGSKDPVDIKNKPIQNTVISITKNIQHGDVYIDVQRLEPVIKKEEPESKDNLVDGKKEYVPIYKENLKPKEEKIIAPISEVDEKKYDNKDVESNPHKEHQTVTTITSHIEHHIPETESYKESKDDVKHNSYEKPSYVRREEYNQIVNTVKHEEIGNNSIKRPVQVVNQETGNKKDNEDRYDSVNNKVVKQQEPKPQHGYEFVYKTNDIDRKDLRKPQPVPKEKQKSDNIDKADQFKGQIVKEQYEKANSDNVKLIKENERSGEMISDDRYWKYLPARRDSAENFFMLRGQNYYDHRRNSRRPFNSFFNNAIKNIRGRASNVNMNPNVDFTHKVVENEPIAEEKGQPRITMSTQWFRGITDNKDKNNNMVTQVVWNMNSDESKDKNEKGVKNRNVPQITHYTITNDKEKGLLLKLENDDNVEILEQPAESRNTEADGVWNDGVYSDGILINTIVSDKDAEESKPVDTDSKLKSEKDDTDSVKDGAEKTMDSQASNDKSYNKKSWNVEKSPAEPVKAGDDKMEEDKEIKEPEAGVAKMAKEVEPGPVEKSGDHNPKMNSAKSDVGIQSDKQSPRLQSEKASSETKSDESDAAIQPEKHGPMDQTDKSNPNENSKKSDAESDKSKAIDASDEQVPAGKSGNVKQKEKSDASKPEEQSERSRPLEHPGEPKSDEKSNTATSAGKSMESPELKSQDANSGVKTAELREDLKSDKPDMLIKFPEDVENQEERKEALRPKMDSEVKNTNLKVNNEKGNVPEEAKPIPSVIPTIISRIVDAFIPKNAGSKDNSRKL